MIKLLITDLDDTLYSWIGFFIPAFYAMVDEVSLILGKDKKELLEEYRKVHQEKGSVEFPYATTFLPSVQAAFPGYSREDILKILDPALYKFNSVRKSHLKLYPNVKETLNEIRKMGIKIVGYTDSSEENGFYRLKKLGIDDLFETVYVSNSQFERPSNISTLDKTRIVYQRKPNPALIQTICNDLAIGRQETIYLGDSLTKDVLMGKMAGVTSILCQYPKDSEKAADLYAKLVTISHWTPEDFCREQILKEECIHHNIQPDETISSFEQLLPIILNCGETE